MCLSLISCDNAIDSMCQQESSSVEKLDIEVAGAHSMLKFIYNAGIVLSILPDLKILLVFSSNLWYKYLARFGVF